MKKERTIAILIVCAVIAWYTYDYIDTYYPWDYEKIADIITQRTANQLQKELDLHLIGIGGRMLNNIQAMHMGFQYFHTVDVESARKLLVTAMQEYLTAINASTRVRPYLNNYPFTAKNIEITIVIQNPDHSSIAVDEIYYLAAINGVLNYYKQHPNPKKVYPPFLQESYEEALQRVS